METRQVYLIQTEGPDGLQSTEVVITDLGEIGEDAIVVFEEAVGVGAEETVAAGNSSCSFSSSGSSSNDSFDSGGGGCGGGGGSDDILSDEYLETSTDCLEEFPVVDPIKLETSDLCSVKLDPDLGVEYETVEDVSLEDAANVYFSVNLESESESSEVLSLGSGSDDMLVEQPLNLVKKDRQRRKLSSSAEGGGKTGHHAVLCKLCNGFVPRSLLESHISSVHGNVDRLSCPDCGKLFTSKRSLFGHKKEKHSGQLDIFPCPDCGKNFSRKSNLKAHRDSLHFGKKFPCCYCDRIFTNRSSMNQHIKKSHADSALPPLPAF